MAVSPDSAILYVTQRDGGTVLVIDTATNDVIDTITVGGAAALVAATQPRRHHPLRRHGRRLGDRYGGGDRHGHEHRAHHRQRRRPCGLVLVSPDGTCLYVTHPNGDTLSVIDAANNTVIATITVGNKPVMVAFSPDGAIAYVTNYGAGTVIGDQHRHQHRHRHQDRRRRPGRCGSQPRRHRLHQPSDDGTWRSTSLTDPGRRRPSTALGKET